ncbi:uncharacterized protein PAF06_015488 [Gastrophryne carolinensis]
MASSVNTPGSSFLIDVLMGWTSQRGKGKSIKDFGNAANSQDKIEEGYLMAGLITSQSEKKNKKEENNLEEMEITQDSNEKIEWLSFNNKGRKAGVSEKLHIDMVSKAGAIEGQIKISDSENNQHEEKKKFEKPNQSYIALISRAILSTPEKRLQLSDIYQWIMDTYPYYHNQDKSWRNSVRHNLSLNECFIKVGRSDNGKGHYWAVHPANLEAFSRGDYQRRRARRRIRRVSSALGSSPRFSPYPLPCDAQRFCIWYPPLQNYSSLNKIWSSVEHLQQRSQRSLSTPIFWPWHHLPPYL